MHAAGGSPCNLGREQESTRSICDANWLERDSWARTILVLFRYSPGSEGRLIRGRAISRSFLINGVVIEPYGSDERIQHHPYL